MSESSQIHTLDQLLRCPAGTILRREDDGATFTKTRRQGLPWDMQSWTFGHAASELLEDELPLSIVQYGERA